MAAVGLCLFPSFGPTNSSHQECFYGRILTKENEIKRRWASPSGLICAHQLSLAFFFLFVNRPKHSSFLLWKRKRKARKGVCKRKRSTQMPFPFFFFLSLKKRERKSVSSKLCGPVLRERKQYMGPPWAHLQRFPFLIEGFHTFLPMESSDTIVIVSLSCERSHSLS